MCWLRKVFVGTVDVPSPSDIIRNDSMISLLVHGGIYVDNKGRHRIKKELLYIPFQDDPQLWICSIPDTNSMDPLFDSPHTNLYIRGVDELDMSIMVSWIAVKWQQFGDANILVYRTPNNYAVHRLVEIKGSERLWYFRGDNNWARDPEPANDEGIEWLMAGVIY